MKLFELPGKAAIVTGAGRGIGKATAELFAAVGASVAVLDISEEHAQRTAEAIGSAGGTAIALTCDVTDESAVEAAFAQAARELGAIVNLASIMGLSGGIFPNSSYQASKGGVVNLTRALALEWAADRIRVNAVAPTFVNTDFTAQIFNNPDVLEKVEAHTPLGVLPEVDDVAAAILFLASPAARCVTGIVLPVDSGYLAR